MSAVSFWCKSCKKDFDDPNFQLRKLSTGEEYFTGYCPKGHKCLRYVTERKIDPYYDHSEKIKAQRHLMANDILQYGEYGFETFYRKEWEKLEKAREEYELNKKRKQQETIDFYNKYKHNINERQLVSKVLEAEEKI